jgi:hypothetical protein
MHGGWGLGGVIGLSRVRGLRDATCEQRFCVDAVTHSQNRQMLLRAMQTNQEMLRAEIILFGEGAPGSGAMGGSGDVMELGGGVLCLAPERADPSLLRETRRVPIYTRISKAEELPRSWRELSATHLLSLIRRTPLSLQQKLKAGERGGPPTRVHMAELLSEWERLAVQPRAPPASDGEDPSAHRVRAREASFDPIAVALVSVRVSPNMPAIIIRFLFLQWAWPWCGYLCRTCVVLVSYLCRTCVPLWISLLCVSLLTPMYNVPRIAKGPTTVQKRPTSLQKRPTLLLSRSLLLLSRSRLPPLSPALQPPPPVSVSLSFTHSCPPRLSVSWCAGASNPCTGFAGGGAGAGGSK